MKVPVIRSTAGLSSEIHIQTSSSDKYTINYGTTHVYCMKLSFHLHLPSFKLFADDFNELSDAVDFVTLTAGFAMEQWREVQVKILIDGKTSHEDDTRLIR